MAYRQLPARSPIPGSALPRLALQTIAYGRDPRAELQSLLIRRFGAQGCELTASGTHALQLALVAARQGRADAPVLLPAYTCYEVATAAVGAEVRVALYDLDPATLEPDWDSVRAAARAGASALVVAPLWGMPLDWGTARATAAELGVLLIEDAAQGHGSTWLGRPVGSFGDLTVLSFGRGKGWTGSGGGALLWRGDHDAVALPATHATADKHRISAEVKAVATAGAQWLFGRPSLYGLPSSIPFLALGETIFHEPRPLQPMTRTSAALLLASDEAASREVLCRRNSSRLYTDALGGIEDANTLVCGIRLDSGSGALRYPVRIPDGNTVLRGSELARLGAAPGYPTTLCALPALRPLLSTPDPALGGADLLARELITLPTHSQLTARDRHRLAALAVALHHG